MIHHLIMPRRPPADSKPLRAAPYHQSIGAESCNPKPMQLASLAT